MSAEHYHEYALHDITAKLNLPPSYFHNDDMPAHHSEKELHDSSSESFGTESHGSIRLECLKIEDHGTRIVQKTSQSGDVPLYTITMRGAYHLLGPHVAFHRGVCVLRSPKGSRAFF